MPTELAEGSVEGSLYSLYYKNNSPKNGSPVFKTKLGIIYEFFVTLHNVVYLLPFCQSYLLISFPPPINVVIRSYSPI